MSDRRRRGDSKWDSREDPPVSSHHIPDNSWPRRGGVQASRGSDDGHNNGQRWSSANEKDSARSRYDSDFSTREDMVGARGKQKDGYNSVDVGRQFDSWEGEGTYTTRMSPGLDDWRKRNRSRSPQDRHDRSPGHRNRNWRRSSSRSRIPDRVRRESEIYDRSSSRTSLSSETCKNFAAGRCRKGNDCRYLHEGSQHHSDAWDNIRQRTGGIPKHLATPESRDPSVKSSRPAELCSHFQRGTCRRGSSCRYVHQLASNSLDKSYQNEDIGVFENDQRRRDISPELGDREPRGHMGLSDRLTNDWSTDNRLEHSLGSGSKMWDNMSSAIGATENANGRQLGMQEELRSAGNLILDTSKTPDWNPQMTSLTHNGTPVTVQEQASMQNASNQIYYASMQPVRADFPPMQPHHGLNENGASVLSSYDQNSISRIAGHLGDTTVVSGMAYKSNLSNQSLGVGASSGLDTVGGHQFVISAEHQKSGNILESSSKPLANEGEQVLQSDFVDPNSSQVALGGPPLQNFASGEHIRQLTDLSASLAHLLGAGNDLPQICAALSSQQMMDVSSALSAIAAGSILPPVQSNTPLGNQKQYDPLSDSLEPNIREDSNKPPFLTVPTGGVNANLNANNVRTEGNDAQEVKETEEKGVEEIENEKEKGKEMQDDEKLENIGKDRGGKKTKEAKNLRAFKFALVEFVKDLMKPTWKEGQMDKEAYKTIVRKVVDKVTGTMQGNIPQSQDKIEQYLTFAKPKLTKLVQAYVEKEKSRKA
ncbi:hypothetical protein MLD38_021492 [Melastoma candidum]|uniref:Uncharacterized protein n=1 Tax=Melastoma candidum TaxID=119954 RepID=A0ACB9QPE2_9MYRT|nr:hypothetical protein MLD38_021492 [Melastoma candidum]